MHWRYLLGTCQSCASRDVFLVERGNPAGRTAARPMAQEPEEIIDSYTDAQALEDGVLVAWDTLPVNRVTRSVFDHFTHPNGKLAANGRCDRHHTSTGSGPDDACGRSRCGWLASRRLRGQATVAGPERSQWTDAYVSGGLLATLTRGLPELTGFTLLNSSRSRLPALLALIKRGYRKSYGVRRPGRLRHDLRPACGTRSAR
jgi:hypothetical protein